MQAEEYEKKALQIAKGFELLAVKQVSCTILSELDVAQGKYRENIQCRDKSMLLKNIAAKKTTLRASEEMAVKYETVKMGYTISVTDNGIGMSEAQLHDIFRLDDAHFRQGTVGEQGSGLGLIACKEVIEKHGGALHVESEEGKGSRF